MRPISRRVAVFAAALLGISSLPIHSARAQKALVYCPVGIDVTGCDAIVLALASSHLAGVDRGYNGTSGTIDLRTADLGAYAVFVVPSLADDAATVPYAFLRDTLVAHRLHDALVGRIALWSGTPDQGTASRAQKDALIQNLASWAEGNFATVNGPGFVALQDNSANMSARYNWLQALVHLQVVADPADNVRSEERRVGKEC